MKTTSDHLFKLVKSLSGSEKRYFKRYSQLHVLHDQNNYSKLFDAIDLQKEYDEKELLQKFSKEPFIKQFSVAKNYLYNSILESLDSYHTYSNSEIRGLLNKTEILVERRLYVQAKKLIDKAKIIAIRHEKLTYIHEINMLELSIYKLGYKIEGMEQTFDALLTEIDQASIQLKNILEYEKLQNKLVLQYRETGIVRNEQEIRKYDWFLKKTLLKTDKRALSVNAKILYYFLYYKYYNLTEDAQKLYNISSKLIDITTKHPHVIEDDINYPTQFLWAHILACNYKEEYREALQYISKMELLKTKSDARKSNTLLLSFNAKLNIYFYMNDIKKCLKLIPEIEQLLVKQSDADTILIQFTYRDIAYFYFLAGQHKQSLKWLVKGNIADSYNARQYLECIMLVMEIILLYELGKFDIIESRIKSTERFLTSKKKMYPVEKNILAFVRKMINANSEDESIQLFRQLKAKLEPFVNDPNGKIFLSYFDIMSWLESKIEHKKFDDVVRSKKK